MGARDDVQSCEKLWYDHLLTCCRGAENDEAENDEAAACSAWTGKAASVAMCVHEVTTPIC